MSPPPAVWFPHAAGCHLRRTLPPAAHRVPTIRDADSADSRPGLTQHHNPSSLKDGRQPRPHAPQDAVAPPVPPRARAQTVRRPPVVGSRREAPNGEPTSTRALRSRSERSAAVSGRRQPVCSGSPSSTRRSAGRSARTATPWGPSTVRRAHGPAASAADACGDRNGRAPDAQPSSARKAASALLSSGLSANTPITPPEARAIRPARSSSDAFTAAR